MLLKPDIYNIDVVCNNLKSTYKIANMEGGNYFSKAASSRGAKVYMLVSKDALGSVNYIGQTIESMKSRFDKGFSNNKYTWSQINGSYNLFVWDLSFYCKKNSSYNLDLLESEMVFFTRINQGRWPKYQTVVKFRDFNETRIGVDIQNIVLDMICHFYEKLLQVARTAGCNEVAVQEQYDRVIYLYRNSNFG